MESTTMEMVHRYIGLVLIVLVVGMFGGRLARVLRIPDVALYLLIGVLVGPILHWVELSPQSLADQLIIIVGAALILFDGGRAIQFGVLKKVWFTLSMLSIPGVLITAVVTAGAAYYLLDLPLSIAFLLAAIIASTDPATLIPVFRQVPIDEKVKQTVESESAFNDATGSIVTFTALGVVTGGQFAVGSALWEFVKMAAGGLIIGLVFGWLATVMISRRRGGFLRDYASIVVIVVALGAYLVGDLMGVSGFMATFTAGLMLGNHQKLGWPTDEERLEGVGHFFEGITLILRMMIFILLGSQVDFSSLADFWWQGLLIVFVFMFIARPLTVFLCAGPDRMAKWTLKELLFMCWVRETGVIPAALVALIAGMDIPHYRAIASVTFMAILITIVLQAGTTGIVARKLGVALDFSGDRGKH
ncbi:cation:proton antiporter [Tumebacillus sp. ITR2]|uniref:Cation:proton antiporter n=1 Tax=Tumebacillus amylolyticus TaxID=2801339 RepID=A0ABS1JCK1_9BACL|nr:cation:proton antiporter [Tumebacillus amylolyticus]MBL0387754.1 cation:proton antiporter [Tumebacillus amylolyticus]